MWPVIAESNKFAFTRAGYYSNDKTFFIPTDDLYLLAILNSSTAFLFFRSRLSTLRGGFFEYRAQTLIHTPIRRISFTTPTEERTNLINEGIALYKQDKHEELLTFVENRLTNQPEQSDVVHDLLVYLAEQMIDLNKQRQDAIQSFITDLEGNMPATRLQKISRLWTPLDPPEQGDKAATKDRAEVQRELGVLAERSLDLREDIGSLSEEQWKWLLKRRLVYISNLADLVNVYRKHQPSIRALEIRIATTDRLINQVVYRLYGLTAEEIAIVEGQH
jgi:hypothetical protein